MNGPCPCGECQAILDQLRNALAEAREFPNTSAWRGAWPRAVAKIAAATEEELDELLDKHPFQFQPEPLRALEVKHPEVSHAFRRFFDHKIRTGHNILRRPPAKPGE